MRKFRTMWLSAVSGAAAAALGAGLASAAAPAQDAGRGREPLPGTTSAPATRPSAATRPATTAAVIAELSISEDRKVSSDDGVEGGRVDRAPDTQIEFLVTGGGVRDATRVVDAQLEEAVDDVGTDLLIRSDRAELARRKAQALRQALVGGRGRNGREPVEPKREQPTVRLWPARRGDAIEVKFDLAQTPRTATTIKRLRGRFSLALGGVRRTVTIDKPVTRAGKDLDDPALAAAGARVALVFGDAIAGRGPPTLHLRVNGRGEALARVRVLAADGRVVGDGLIDVGKEEDGERTDMTILTRPADDTMRVEIDLVAEQKVLPFEFDLKDIPLP